MYPRNAASPLRIAIGAVVQISDGAVQTTGVSGVHRDQSGAETAVGGTLAVGATSSIWYYTPTQAETNHTAFTIAIYKAGCVPVAQTIVTTASATAGMVDVGAISGDSVAADNAEAFFDGTGYAGTNNVIPTVTTTATATNVTTVNGLAANVITAASIAADAITAAKIADGAIDAATFAAGAINAAAIAADAIGASELAADAVAEIADAVWDEARAGHVAAGSFGEGVVVNSIAAGAITAAAIATGAIDADALAADAVAEIADGVWDEDIVAAHSTANTAGLFLKDVEAAVDTEVAAIKAKTDQLTFTVANRVDSQVLGVAAGAIDTGDLSAALLNEIADAILDRNMATGTDSGSTTVRTPRQALRVLRNRAAISAGTLTVYKEDDSVSSWTGVVTTSAGNPISEIDPAGP